MNHARNVLTLCTLLAESPSIVHLGRWKEEGESARRVDDMSSLTNALFLPLHVRTSRGLIWENKTYKLKVYFPGGGTLHMKGVGMLVVSLRGCI